MRIISESVRNLAMETLKAEGWKFKQVENYYPDFKSPRMKEWDSLIGQEPTEAGYRKEEVDVLMGVLDGKLQLAIDSTVKDFRKHYREVLSSGGQHIGECRVEIKYTTTNE